jgi:phytoene/squalene synthetase
MLIKAEELSNLTLKDGGIFKVHSIDKAYDFCKKIATGHYENFPVGSFLIPNQFRKYFYSVYAFSRIADDIADDISIEKKDYKIKLLNDYKNLITTENIDGNPIFIALHDTMIKREIPPEPLQKLIKAFIMDSEFEQPNDFDDVLYYCEHSANPIGEMVLRIFGLYNHETTPLSDNICTGLQLANFWQDISTDKKMEEFTFPKKF